MVVQTYPFKSRIFHVLEALNGTPPATFELEVREQNQLGFWNISIRPTSGTLSQTMTLKPFVIDKNSDHPRAFFVALHDIAETTELLWDYNDPDWMCYSSSQTLPQNTS